MRYSLYINQIKSMEWGLNIQQAILFSYLHDLPTWGMCQVVDGDAYWWSGKDKIISELPILTDKPDTIKRHMASLEKAGLIERITYQNRPLVRITDKGKLWNHAEDSREKNPASNEKVGKNIPTKSGKKSPPSREKNPAYKYTNDQITNDHSDKKNKQKNSLDFSCWPELPSEQIFNDWKLVRTRKRAPITQTVIDRMAVKFRNAREQLGLGVDDVLGICIERGWQGFEVQWLAKCQMDSQPSPANRQEALEMRNQTAIEQWLGHDAGNTYENGE